MSKALKLALVIIVCTVVARAQQDLNPNLGVLASPVDENTVVRFFYHPPISDRLVLPLVLRVASNNDERMETAPVLKEGRTVFITHQEMKNLVTALTHSVMLGQQTRNVEVLGSWQLIPSMESMDVVIIFSQGAARGEVSKNAICSTLDHVSNLIKTLRARWELDRFSVYQGCRVSGFDITKYHDQ